MSEIIPNGDIELYRNIPLDREYNHTWYFTSANGQMLKMREYLANQYSTFTNLSYMRSGKNEIKIECAIANLQDVNYMSFINKTPFESRRYFAFVDDIEYINNETTKLYYRIDPIQTYFFDYDIMPSFVEREHAASDELFENVIPEDFKNMELVISFIDDTYIFDVANPQNRYYDFMCVVAYPNKDSTYDFLTGLNQNPLWAPSRFFVSPVGPIGGMADPVIITDSSGYRFYRYDTSLNKTMDIIRTLISNNWNICDVYAVPAGLHALTQWSSASESSGVYRNTHQFDIAKNFKIRGNPDKTYTPKNKKLYNFPYKQISIVSPLDGQKDYSPELFTEYAQPYDSNYGIASVYFGLQLNEVPQCKGYVFPINYNSFHNSAFYGDFNGLNLETLSYPVSWTEDSFSKYLTQQLSAHATHAIVKSFSVIPHSMQTANFANLISGRAKGFTPGIAVGGAVASGLNAIADIMSATLNAYNAPDISGGQLANSVSLQEHMFGFYIIEYNIRPEQAKIVDDFFTMYGYATKSIKQPNRNARTSFTYVKTVNCEIEPKNKGMQNSAKEEIQEIYNHGITFWHSDKTIGDYTVANDPTGNIGG